VRFRLAAAAAFLIFRRAAAFCLLDAMLPSLMPLEELYGAFMLLRFFARRERAQIAASSGPGVLFA
jgi:hypothetical protein